ncbi:MAG: Foldase protein PrsA [Candidatus Gottesmanbacteria bacterium GW2011_GWA2_44_17]|uniref:Foldase protein PrsA n=1 Tax=Candidatus Gottesmanbacteria bacterium GW2011_GWA2_44_17 TaxID=1618444 RepID=A0A0G1JQX7_9BACT|nr:MAG: Foldase protein PrsA [Microgenomates group bacterium GW2011_GWC1_43_11]KKT46317.1 MAG: Foldase protein PrsA [Candidatus Gottesmanbacteria bacterium GW2011_GWA2_44_17]
MKAVKRTEKLVKKSEKIEPDFMNTASRSDEKSCCYLNTRNKTPIIIGVLTIVLLLALAVSKGYVLVAIINNKPIFRFQLTQTLMSRFGKQTLEGMISEKLIAEDARRSGVVVTQEEIDKQEEEVLKSFGGKVTLDELLKFQGTTKSEFDGQIRLQLLVNKLLEKDITVTDEEIASYRETNKALMVSSDEADLKEEARKALLEQKINEKIQPWFTELKNKAKIFKFF